MKCPYCGIYCTDDERECPVCGKRLTGVPKSQKRSADQSHKEIPHQPKKQPAAQSTERKQTYGNKSTSTESAWQKAAAGQHIHDNPLEHKKQSGGIGCLIAILIFLAFMLFPVMGSIGYSIISDSDISEDFSSFFEDDVYEETDISSVLTGTWRNTDGTLTLTIDEEGVVTWSDADGIHSDGDPLFENINLTDDNQEDYCSADDLQDYPPDSYTYYSIYAVASEWDDDSCLEMWFYFPQDEQSPEIFDYYDYYEETYNTFTLVSDSTEPMPAGPEQTA